MFKNTYYNDDNNNDNLQINVYITIQTRIQKKSIRLPHGRQSASRSGVQGVGPDLTERVAS